MRKERKLRRLIYVPIIHVSADLGEVASEIDKRAGSSFGKEDWKKHKDTVSGFWDSIVRYFFPLEVKDFKVYQDGMVADGEMGMRIVSEGEKKGSINYKIVSRLVKQGAQLVRTEDFSLVKKEYDYIIKIARAKKMVKRIIAALNYRVHKKKLLRERDESITDTIDKTLGKGETGILFLGAHHEIVSKLPEDIDIIEVKKRDIINKYQKAFLSKKDKEKLSKLAEYLTSPIECK
ncbi:MAG: hypothetical protein KAW19_05925 [Candidatus Aminicenantes bacterium]|nr:hypothetical protein [Candidatus Aminicenantes bacterium]